MSVRLSGDNIQAQYGEIIQKACDKAGLLYRPTASTASITVTFKKDPDRDYVKRPDKGPTVVISDELSSPDPNTLSSTVVIGQDNVVKESAWQGAFTRAVTNSLNLAKQERAIVSLTKSLNRWRLARSDGQIKGDKNGYKLVFVSPVGKSTDSYLVVRSRDDLNGAELSDVIVVHVGRPATFIKGDLYISTNSQKQSEWYRILQEWSKPELLLEPQQAFGVLKEIAAKTPVEYLERLMVD